MININVFELLVLYHCEKNLPEWLKYAYIKDGMLLPKDGSELEEGLSENKYTKGSLIISNGDTLVNRLIEDDIVVDEKIPDWTYIYGKDDFYNYLNKYKNIDNSYVVDKKNGRITRIKEFNNNIKGINFSEMLPSNFLSEDGKVSIEEIGLKTRNAIRTAKVYSKVISNQLKATPFGNTKTGKATEFDKQGLSREFFFKYDPNSTGPFIDKDNRIIGIYRIYRDENGNATRDKDAKLIPFSEKIVNKYLQ